MCEICRQSQKRGVRVRAGELAVRMIEWSYEADEEQEVWILVLTSLTDTQRPVSALNWFPNCRRFVFLHFA